MSWGCDAVCYTVKFTTAAARELRKLSRDVQQRIRPRIDELANDPRPPNASALHGADRGLLRIRIGDCRVVYSVEDDVVEVLIIRIRHRSDAYD